MADYGTRKTDEAVKRAERRLRRVYKEAQEDIAEKLKAWQEAHKASEAKYRKMVADGKMSQADFDAWMRGQVFQDKQWQARKKEIDQVLLNADKAAAKIVNEGKIGVFADNANYIGYGLEHDLRIDSGFTLYDESTVARLIQDDPQILPLPAPGVVKDKAFPYYNRLMSSAITQGILQGETIGQIAKRIMDKTGESSYNSAVRNARTAYTGAQNAGRIEGLHQAQRLGIEVKKKWLATLDFRTRDTHRDLDGQIRNVDEPFQVDGDEIMFPGDPTAKPGLVYNCRCTLIYEYPEYPSSMERLDNITREKIGDISYREWERMKLDAAEASDKSRHGYDVTMGITPERRTYGKTTGMQYSVTDNDEITLSESGRQKDASGSWVDFSQNTGSVTVPDNTDNEKPLIYSLPSGAKTFLAQDETKNCIMTHGRIAINRDTANNNTRARITEMLENEIDILGGIRKDGTWYRVTSNAKDAEYIKAGTIRQSVNHATGEKEAGLSVWERPKYYDKYLERLSGDIIGIGADGEPLLDVKTVKILESIDIEKAREIGRKRFLELYKWTKEQLDAALEGRYSIKR